jgi:hypothetical protein
MSGTPERILAARGAWLAARDAWLDWLAAMAASEARRREVVRLWLEYLELAEPVHARKIRRLLKYGEIEASTADELSTESAVPLGRSIPLPQESLPLPQESQHAPLGQSSANGFDPAMQRH